MWWLRLKSLYVQQCRAGPPAPPQSARHEKKPRRVKRLPGFHFSYRGDSLGAVCMGTAPKLLADFGGGMITTMARDRNQQAIPDLFSTASVRPSTKRVMTPQNAANTR